jgi:hypothetical protein
MSVREKTDLGSCFSVHCESLLGHRMTVSDASEIGSSLPVSTLGRLGSGLSLAGRQFLATLSASKEVV